MLLPSALDCAPRIQSPRFYMASTAILSPPSSSCHSPTSPVSSNIYSACRSLQSLITTGLPSTASSVSRPPRTQPHLASPIALTSTSAHSKQSRPRTKACTKIAQPQTPPRPSRKRRRSLSDDDGSSHDQENIPNFKPSTPKRQRLCPPTLPLGLKRADFDALQEQAANIPIPTTPENRQEEDLLEASAQSEWSPLDDSALVSLILHKLRLRQSDWDECARRLGKGKDSIGERWKLLLGEGEVGLRMGSGKQRRGNVQRMEFGGSLERG